MSNQLLRYIEALLETSSVIAASRRLGIWSRSYFAATAGGVTLDVLKQYVENQGYD